MKTPKLILKNDNGSAIIVAIMVLVLLTIIGIAATNNSSFESQIIGNEHRYQIDFYVADSGWKEGAMWLEGSGGPPPKKNPGTSELVRNWADRDATDPPPGIQDVLATPDNDCDTDGIDNDGDSLVDETGELCLSKYGVPYWYQVEWMADDIVAGSGSGWREFYYTVRSNANRTQEIEVILSKIFKVGY
jgi:Tfp pilus assembly protein PilX